MIKYMKTNVNNQILNQLVLENCLRFGRDPKFNNRKANHYIFGTREKLDIFKLYELRYLLLKVYPLIHNLFLQVRLNVKKKKKFVFNRKFNFKKFAPYLPELLREWEQFQVVKKKFNQSLMKINKPVWPQIFFATTNETYSDIVSSAARMCHMPFHVNRWPAGAITAGSSYKSEKEKWFFLKDTLNIQLQKWFQNKFCKHKKNSVQQINQMRKYQFSRKPSLFVIPDVSNNEMILRETNVLGIPVIGLVNSNCQNLVTYPIFANDQSLYSIHFFCHFLSSLITKEIVKTKKKLNNISKKTVNMQLPQALENMSRFYTKRAKVSPRLRNLTQNTEQGFKGKYFTEHYQKPRYLIRKKANRGWNVLPLAKKKKDVWEKNMKSNVKINKLKSIAFNKTIGSLKKTLCRRKGKIQSINAGFKHVSFKHFFSNPKKKSKIAHINQLAPHYLNQTIRKTIFLENQKNLKKYGIKFSLKKRMLQRMNLILQLKKFSFSKIKRAIRLRTNLPKFRFWKAASSFYHRKPIKLATNTATAFTFRRFGLKRLVKKIFRQRSRWEPKRGRSFHRKGKRKKTYRPPGYRGYQHTEEFNRYLIKTGVRIDYNPAFEKNLKKVKVTSPITYRKRWPSKKVKKK